MSKNPRPPAESEGFYEQQFYLEEFRGRTLLLALPADAVADEAGEQHLAALARTLITNDTKLVVLLAARPGDDIDALRRTLQRRLQRRIVVKDTLPLFRDGGRRPHRFVALDGNAIASPAGIATLLSQVWSVLRDGPLFVGIAPQATRAAAVRFAAKIAARLRVQKLVVLQSEGGLTGSDGKTISFMDEATMAALLATGEAEYTGLGPRRDTLAAMREGLLAGIGSANLCSLAEAARELFTYEGAGTLFTLEDYCRVEPLGIDDFEEAERLIERGQREGVLKPRSPDEIAELLVNSFGATIGSHHLAGMCALVTAPYRRQRAGEIVGLYTITRFKGEGVGIKLVAKALADARAQRLRYVFATTTVDRAQAFFERCGFHLVGPDDVPASKWDGYDHRRRSLAVVLRIEI